MGSVSRRRQTVLLVSETEARFVNVLYGVLASMYAYSGSINLKREVFDRSLNICISYSSSGRIYI